jgi:hypothetical protein
MMPFKKHRAASMLYIYVDEEKGIQYITMKTHFNIHTISLSFIYKYFKF